MHIRILLALPETDWLSVSMGGAIHKVSFHWFYLAYIKVSDHAFNG